MWHLEVLWGWGGGWGAELTQLGGQMPPGIAFLQHQLGPLRCSRCFFSPTSFFPYSFSPSHSKTAPASLSNQLTLLPTSAGYLPRLEIPQLLPNQTVPFHTTPQGLLAAERASSLEAPSPLVAPPPPFLVCFSFFTFPTS